MVACDAVERFGVDGLDHIQSAFDRYHMIHIQCVACPVEGRSGVADGVVERMSFGIDGSGFAEAGFA